MNDHAQFLHTSSEVAVQRWDGARASAGRDCVAEEVPLALIYNGTPHAVMMASPSDIEDFALGFSLSEAVIDTRAQFRAVETDHAGDGIAVYIDIDKERALRLESQHRNLAGRTGCGLCGAETIEQAVRHPAPVGDGVRVAAQALQRALARLAQRQALNAKTGAVHAAAWATPDGELVAVREDVGRHNALDKLIGDLARREIAGAHGFVVLTSRVSVEMVHKAAVLGATIIVAISAPTALAIRTAERAGITLVAIARSDGFEIFTHAQRIRA